MTPTKIKTRVLLEKVAWIRRMLDSMRQLPTDSFAGFRQDPRNIAAMESFLRRALEALLDLGRHILAKRFGEGVVEYKAIATALGEREVLSPGSVAILVEMAGYRNRLTHFYNEVTAEELYEILTTRTGDIETVLDEILAWVRSHPQAVDDAL